MIKQCMSTQVYAVSADEPISRARNLMLKHDIGRLIVIGEENNPVGIVTKKDITKRLAQAEPTWRRRPIDNIPVSLVMTENLLNIHQEATVAQAAEIMLENEISGLPVIKKDNDDVKLVGIITKHDLIRHYSTKEYITKVKDVMDTYVVTVNIHHTIDHALYEMDENNVNVVVVLTEGNKPAGVISRDNLAFTELTDANGNVYGREVKMARRDAAAGVKKYRYIREMPLVAEDVMAPLDNTVTSNERVVDAAKIMSTTGTKSLIVIDDEIVGILRADNILNEIKKQT
ncbi:MAG: CBS domain-containing protein [Methanosarcinales archaeon]|uniref:CBS domain-containing protein n=1 Tax=Candidatus Ethanoperedens thermophilum TaxID=2766897 RepID=A0A848D826_9EURY|nr:CBS domain-containing protein [Candidatus Ethanoperedens thermophilum]